MKVSDCLCFLDLGGTVIKNCPNGIRRHSQKERQTWSHFVFAEDSHSMCCQSVLYLEVVLSSLHSE